MEKTTQLGTTDRPFFIVFDIFNKLFINEWLIINENNLSLVEDVDLSDEQCSWSIGETEGLDLLDI